MKPSIESWVANSCPDGKIIVDSADQAAIKAGQKLTSELPGPWDCPQCEVKVFLQRRGVGGATVRAVIQNAEKCANLPDLDSPLQ